MEPLAGLKTRQPVSEHRSNGVRLVAEPEIMKAKERLKRCFSELLNLGFNQKSCAIIAPGHVTLLLAALYSALAAERL